MMQQALRRLLSEVLGIVAEDGLPGEHHFYISFDTTHPGTVIADWLREAYPEEMTIVLQHDFHDLAVIGDRFQVSLSFRGAPETLVVPLEAVTTFVDPSVEFGLKFDGHDAEEDDELEPDLPETDAAEEAEIDTGIDVGLDADLDDGPDEPPPSGSAEVVSLDKFRKS